MAYPPPPPSYNPQGLNNSYYNPQQGYTGQPAYPQQPAYAQPNYGQQQAGIGHQPPQPGYGMQPSQPYAPPPTNLPGFIADSKVDVGNRLAPKPKWNDLIFALLFMAQFAAFVVISVIAIKNTASTFDQVKPGLGNNGGNAFTLSLSTAYLLSFICGAALLLAIGLLVLVRAFTKAILEICLLLSVVFSVGYAIYLWLEKYWSGAVIFTLFAILSIIVRFHSICLLQSAIEQQDMLGILSDEETHTILKTVSTSNVTNRKVELDEYKSTYGIALLGTIVQALYSVWWSFTIAASYQKWDPQGETCRENSGGCSQGPLIGICVFLLFSYYWTTQFIGNIVLTTEAGIFITWYFTGGKSSNNPPRNVAWGAFKRASTYSMGSIAFGSLIVALLDMLKVALHILQSQAAEDGNIIGCICACVAGCCVSMMTWLVEFFNRYAYIEIAIYGKPFMGAAKDVWRLIKDRGIDALINDSLVNTIWTFGSYAVGALCSLFAFLYLRVDPPQYIEVNSNLTAVVLLYAFVIGFQITHSLGYGCISAGVSTIFVGLAEEPQILAQRDPILFSMIQETYPNVSLAPKPHHMV